MKEVHLSRESVKSVIYMQKFLPGVNAYYPRSITMRTSTRN